MPDLPPVGNLSIYLEIFVAVLRVAIVFGLVILVHELGHFIVAKKMNVKVERFSLGFGKKLIGRKWGETEYLISVFPLGGYCKMAGEMPGEVSKEPEREFTSKTVGQRAAIIIAGPLMNYLFAFPMAIACFWMGINEATSRIGDPEPGHPAFEAGLKKGDRIVAIDGRSVGTFTDLHLSLNLYDPAEPHNLDIERTEKGETVRLTKTIQSQFDSSTGQYHIGVPKLTSTTIGYVGMRSPAKKAGFQQGDRILSVDGHPVATWAAVREAINRKEGKPVEMVIERGDPPQPYRGLFQPLTRQARLLGIELRNEPVVGYVQGDSPAKLAGLAAGDRVETVDGQPAATWGEVEDLLQARLGKPIELAIRRGEESAKIAIPAVTDANWEGSIGIAPGENIPAIVRAIMPNSKALAAGLKLGDRIVEANGQRIESAADLPGALKSGTDVAKLVARRGEGQAAQSVQLSVPLIEQMLVANDIGVLPEAEFITERYPIGRAMLAGCRSVFVRTGQNVFSMYMLFTGKVSGTLISGPAGILTMAYLRAREGLADLLDLFVFFSIGLAFLNLLPVPILDGGHLLFLAIEKIKGSRLPERTLEIAQYVGLFLLLALLLYATWNDVDRFFLPWFR